MSGSENWPTIMLGDDEKAAGYVHPENVKLLLDLTQASLQSQLDGVRQMFSRGSCRVPGCCQAEEWLVLLTSF